MVPRLFGYTRAVIVVAAVLALGGCDVAVGQFTGRATDDWVRSYPLAAGGEVSIGNTNGRVEVEGIDGTSVEVRAERIARATTDTAARELLPRIVIKEDIKPDRVALETERMPGVLIGAAVEVRYYVKVPRNANVRLNGTNGGITVTSIEGRVDVRTTNGAVVGRDLRGAVDAGTTNGSVNIELASLSGDGVRLRTTNGSLQIAMPESAKANLSASCTNGKIDASGLKLEVREESRRSLDARLNGGGPAVELKTTNGSIRIRSRSAL